MIKKNKEKVIYLVTNADKKAPLISLYSLPTKCPVCHSFKEPQQISFKYNHNDDAMVQFRCLYDKCKSSFSALYLQGSYGAENFHFISFL